VVLKRVEQKFSPPLLLIFLPAKAEVLGVDPTRLELVTFPMRRQHEEIAVVHRCSETPANKHIYP
jgi:hypothetical protein